MRVYIIYPSLRQIRFYAIYWVFYWHNKIEIIDPIKPYSTKKNNLHQHLFSSRRVENFFSFLEIEKYDKKRTKKAKDELIKGIGKYKWRWAVKLRSESFLALNFFNYSLPLYYTMKEKLELSKNIFNGTLEVIFFFLSTWKVKLNH